MADDVSDFFGGLIDIGGDIVGTFGNILEDVGDFAIDVVDSIGDAAQKILDDPIPIFLQVAGGSVGIPPYVTAAVITAAKGGNLQDIAVSAAVSYGATEFMKATELGKTISQTTAQAGKDFTSTLIQDFNLPTDYAQSVAKAATASLNSGVIGGVRAALTGQSITSGIASGMASGAIYSGTASFFDSLNKDPSWGFGDKALNLMKGATSSVLNAAVSGKGDLSAALGNYIAYTTLQAGKTFSTETLQKAYNDFTGKTAEAEAAQDKWTEIKAKYDAAVVQYNTDRTKYKDDYAALNKDINENFTPFKTKIDEYDSQIDAQIAARTSNIEIYNNNKWAYDNYAQWAQNNGYTAVVDDAGNEFYIKYTGWKDVGILNADGSIGSYKQPTGFVEAPTRKEIAATANAAAKAANAATEEANRLSGEAKAFVSANQPMLDRIELAKTNLDALGIKLEQTQTQFNESTANSWNTLADQLKKASTEYQTKYDAYAKSQEGLNRAAENYNNILTDTTGRNAIIDLINSGALKVTSVDQVNGQPVYKFDTGIEIQNGKLYQGGKELFTNAAGIEQMPLTFRDPTGNEVRFDSKAGSVLSSTDVQNIFKRDYGIDINPEVAQRFAGQALTTANKDAMQGLALDRITQEFRDIANRNPTKDEIAAATTSPNALAAAQEAAANTLDLPADYKFPTQDQKISFAKAFANARATFGPNATFTWEGKDYTTATQEEVVQKKAAEEFKQTYAPAFAEQDITSVRAKMLARANDPIFNPTNLSEKDLTLAIQNYTSASPEKRRDMLENSYDRDAFKVIDTLLKQASGEGKVLPNTSFVSEAAASDSLKPSDLTNYRQVINAGFRGAAADMIGVGARGFQLLGQALGYDTNIANAIQQAMSEDKDKQMSKLVGNERVIAGGLASGIESGLTFALGGGIPSVVTMMAIAANNTWIESTEAVIDKKGNAWPSAEEARKNGVFEYRSLTPEEAGKRTAIMTAIEGTMEKFGLPGMRVLAKGIPITGSADEIIAAIKAKAGAMFGEQVTELLTTTAQMAADKWTSFGLGQNATLKDYVNALQDTALATAVAVGTATASNRGAMAIQAATHNMEMAQNNSPSVFSSSTSSAQSGEDLTLDSLKTELRNRGLSEQALNFLTGGMAAILNQTEVPVEVAAQPIKEYLTQVGVPPLKVEAYIKDLTQAQADVKFAEQFAGLNLPESVLEALRPIVTNQIINHNDADNTAKAITNALSQAFIDSFTAYNTAMQVVPTANIPSPPISADSFIVNQYANPIVKSQYSPDFVGPIPNDGTNIGPFGNDLTVPIRGTVTGPTQQTTTSTTPSITLDQLKEAIANINLPESISKTDVINIVDQALKDNPGLSKTDVQTIVRDVVSKLPTAPTLEAISNKINEATSSLVTQKQLDIALANIDFPAGLSREDVAAEIKAYMTANPGLKPADVTAAIASYMTANPPLTKADVTSTINSAVANLVTKDQLTTALANIQFPPGLSKTDVTNAISEYMKANPGLSLSDVASKVTEATKGLATTAGVNDAISTALKDVATKADITAAIANIKFPAGLSQADVTKAITDYMKANPGLSLTDVAGKITEATKGLATTTGVNDAISTALKDVATKTDIATAIANIQFPAGLTKTDVTNAINDYMKANPGLSLTDVAAKISEATKGLATTTGVNTAISTALKDVATKTDIATAIANIQFPAGLTQADVTKAISDYMKANPGLSLTDVAAKITEATKGLATTTGVNDAISTALKGVATKADIDTAIANIKFPQGITKADVAAEIKAYMDANPGLTVDQVTTAIKDQIAKLPEFATPQQLTSAIGSAKEALQTQISESEKRLSAQMQDQYDKMSEAQKAEVNARVQLGVTLNEAIADVAKTTTAAITASEQTLRQEIGKLGTDVAEKFDAMDANQKAEVLARVQMGSDLQKSIDAVAKTLTAAQQEQYNALSKGQKDLFDQMVAQGKTQSEALTTAISGVEKQIGDLDKTLSDRIATNEAAGLARDVAIQKAIEEVAASAGINKTDLLTRIGKTETDLKAQIQASQNALSSQIASLGADVSSKFQTLSDAQKAEVLLRIQQGEELRTALDNAIYEVNVATDQKIQQAFNMFGAAFGSLDRSMQLQLANMSQAQQKEVAARTQMGQDLTKAVSDVGAQVTKTAAQIRSEIAALGSDVNARFDAMDAASKAEVLARVQMGQDINSSIQTVQNQIAQSQQQTVQKIEQTAEQLQTKFQTDFDRLVAEGKTQQEATDLALANLGTQVSDIQKQQILDQKARADAAAAQKAAADKAVQTSTLASAAALLGGAGAAAATPTVEDTAKFKSPFVSSKGPMAKFVGPLQEYLQMVEGGNYTEDPYAGKSEEQPQQQATAGEQELNPQNQAYFNYGQSDDIENILSQNTTFPNYNFGAKEGGLIPPLMATGGTTRYGKYAGGGLNVVNHSGKNRFDFRKGDAVTGEGDGQSDDIPAMLADGEFVFPADVVAALGNGSTKAGSDKLYDMMHAIRSRARSSHPKELPPPALSPLDYLKKSSKSGNARR